MMLGFLSYSVLPVTRTWHNRHERNYALIEQITGTRPTTILLHMHVLTPEATGILPQRCWSPNTGIVLLLCFIVGQIATSVKQQYRFCEKNRSRTHLLAAVVCWRSGVFQRQPDAVLTEQMYGISAKQVKKTRVSKSAAKTPASLWSVRVDFTEVFPIWFL